MSQIEDALRHLIREVVREIVREELEQMRGWKEAYSEAEFCELVGISKHTAQRMRAVGELQYTQVGRRVLYSRKNVQDFLERHEAH